MPKRDDNREWKRFHNEQQNSLYRSPNIVRVIKSLSERSGKPDATSSLDKMEVGRTCREAATR